MRVISDLIIVKKYFSDVFKYLFEKQRGGSGQIDKLMNTCGQVLKLLQVSWTCAASVVSGCIAART